MIKTNLIIDGMSCGMCESHINDVIRSKFDVKKVKSSHKRGETEIISNDVLNHDELKAAIQETGYEVLSIENEPYKKKGIFG